LDVPLWALLVLSTVAVVAASGWLATRDVLNHPPRQALR
jgi:hypothetical protein